MKIVPNWRVVALVFVLVGIAFASVFVLAASAFYDGNCKRERCMYKTVKPYKAKLRSIRACETRGLQGAARWRYNGSSGFDGAYQFSPPTWSNLSPFTSYAWQASRIEQSYRAVVLAARNGWVWRSTATWPNCG